MLTRNRLRRSTNKSKRKSRTLLQKAQVYNEMHPDKQEDTSEEQEKSESDFLEEYYAAMKMKQNQEEQLKKAQPPKLHLRLEYLLPNESYGNPTSSDNLSIAGDSQSVIKKESLTCSCPCFTKQPHKVNSRLKITIIDSVQLNKLLADGVPKIKKCQVKCSVYTNDSEQPMEVKTGYAYCNDEGAAAWYHELILKGFNSQELSETYVVFKLKGTNQDGKLILGEAILGGSEAGVNFGEEGMSRPTTSTESDDWKNSLTSPGRAHLTAPIIRHCIDGKLKAITSLLSKEAKRLGRGDFNITGLFREHQETTSL